MKTKKLNYTTVCHYCGVIFENNRSTKKYCDGHNAMYHTAGGPQLITTHVLNTEGVLFDVDPYLEAIYNHREEKLKDGWHQGNYEFQLRREFNYKGPLPKGSEYLVLGSYVIKRWVDLKEVTTPVYRVKPFTLLTPQERATKVFEGKRKDT